MRNVELRGGEVAVKHADGSRRQVAVAERWLIRIPILILDHSLIALVGIAFSSQASKFSIISSLSYRLKELINQTLSIGRLCTTERIRKCVVLRLTIFNYLLTCGCSCEGAIPFKDLRRIRRESGRSLKMGQVMSTCFRIYATLTSK